MVKSNNKNENKTQTQNKNKKNESLSDNQAPQVNSPLVMKALADSINTKCVGKDNYSEDNNLNSDKILNQFDSIIDSLSVFRNQINLLQQQLRNLEKSVRKEVKTLKKVAQKNKNKGNRKPSGFANPTKVSKELCEFMNKKEGSEIARTEVTKAIISYIKNNNLQNKTNKKIISPDDKLKFLLGITEEEELTYFNLQKYMNKHFNSNLVSQETHLP